MESSSENEVFLITPGQSFLGAWMTRSLLESGARFVVLDSRPRNDLLAQIVPPELLAAAPRVFSRRTDAASLAEILEKHRVTQVVDLRALEEPTSKLEPRRSSFEDLLQAVALRQGAVASLVYALADEGSVEVDAARRILGEGGPAAIGVRVQGLLGVGLESGPLSEASRAVKAAVLARLYTLPFAGTLEVSYVEDVARTILALSRSRPEEPLRLSAPRQAVAVEELLAAIEHAVPECVGKILAFGVEAESEFSLAESEIDALLGDNAPPLTPIAECVARMATHFRLLAEEGRLHDRDLR